MTFLEIKNWFSFVQQAPEGIRKYLESTIWILVFLVLIWAILKLLFNSQFKELYRLIGLGAKKAGKVGKVVAKEMAKGLELPEPYPRFTRCLEIAFMVNGYAASFFFVSFFLAFVVLLVLSNFPGFWARTGGMLFAIVLGYFAWFFFAQSEKDRIRLFRNSTSKNS